MSTPNSKVRVPLRLKLTAVALGISIGSQSTAVTRAPEPSVPLSPSGLLCRASSRDLLVTCAGSKVIVRFDTAKRRVADHIPLPGPPGGLAISPDSERLFVACPATESKICIFDLASTKLSGEILSGHNATATVAGLDGKTLYACNRFDNDVSVINLARGTEMSRISVQREPLAADITKDGKYLLVANRLPAGRADANYCGAVVSVIDTATGKVLSELRLPNGSGSLNDLRLSPDGRYSAVTHLVANFKRGQHAVSRTG